MPGFGFGCERGGVYLRLGQWGTISLVRTGLYSERFTDGNRVSWMDDGGLVWRLVGVPTCFGKLFLRKRGVFLVGDAVAQADSFQEMKCSMG